MEPNHTIAAIWVTTLLAAALSDLRSFRISNAFPAIQMLMFAAAYGFVGFSATLWPNLFHFLLALIVGMVLFGRGWIGGGDAKLYAAVALWFDWSGAAALIFLTGVSGLLLTIAFIVARKLGLRKNVPKEDRRIPYGVAIAAGAILSAAWRGWNNIFPAFSL
jgi:prepilin peptidase CpaA